MLLIWQIIRFNFTLTSFEFDFYFISACMIISDSFLFSLLHMCTVRASEIAPDHHTSYIHSIWRISSWRQFSFQPEEYRWLRESIEMLQWENFHRRERLGAVSTRIQQSIGCLFWKGKIQKRFGQHRIVSDCWSCITFCRNLYWMIVI